jgi:hypothetical protein
MRFLLSLLFAAGLLSPAASAQIFALHFKDEKAAKNFSKQLYDLEGEQVMLVMIKSGVTEKPDGSGFQWTVNTRLEFFVQDQDDPSKVSYKIVGNELEAADKSLVIGIQSERVDSLQGFMPRESFATLAKEYERRVREMEDLSKRQAEEQKGSPAWFALGRVKVQSMEQLHIWLRETGYARAANKLERDLLRERKSLDEGAKERINRAIGSIKESALSPKFVEVAGKVAPGVKFAAQESQHLRIVYHDEVDSGRVTALLELGERAIELFKNEFVDPYAGDDFKDMIPDGMFEEFYFGREDQIQYERMLVEYYGQGWGSGKEKEDRLKAQGSRRNFEKLALAYWKIGKQEDLEGIVLHELGHTLATLHYEIISGQDWLTEGSGYYLSFALLSRNNVNCFAFEPEKGPGEGTVAKGPGGEKPKPTTKKTAAVMQGAREVMAEMALMAGPPMDQLAKKELWNFANEDMAKSWAWYDWISRRCGKQGQLWLRRSSKIANVSRDAFLLELRKMTAEVFALAPDKDPVQVLEERWKEYLKKEYDLRVP